MDSQVRNRGQRQRTTSEQAKEKARTNDTANSVALTFGIRSTTCTSCGSAKCVRQLPNWNAGLKGGQAFSQKVNVAMDLLGTIMHRTLQASRVPGTSAPEGLRRGHGCTSPKRTNTLHGATATRARGHDRPCPSAHLTLSRAEAWPGPSRLTVGLAFQAIRANGMAHPKEGLAEDFSTGPGVTWKIRTESVEAWRAGSANLSETHPAAAAFAIKHPACLGTLGITWLVPHHFTSNKPRSRISMIVATVLR